MTASAAEKPAFTVYSGTFVSPVDMTRLEYVSNGAIGVDATGTIRFVERGAAGVDEVLAKHKELLDSFDVKVFEIHNPSSSFFFPGFFDTHIVSLT